MFAIWIAVWILATQINPPDHDAVAVWHWFGAHELITVLLILFLA